MNTVPECCATEYSLTPPDSPITNDGGPKLHKKKKSVIHCRQANTKDETFDAKNGTYMSNTSNP